LELVLSLNRAEEWSSPRGSGGTTLDDPDSKKDQLNEADLNAVTGGSAVDTIIGAAKQVWNIITNPAPSGVKGEAKDKDHSSWIE
jgi:hypothetical protein